MNKSLGFHKWRQLLLLMALIQPVTSQSEDIDLFVGGRGSATGNPNILFILDNTSNWARQSQQWPGGEQQGQSEAAAIKEVFNDTSLTGLNVGIMEFVTGGNANNNGGFIRLAINDIGSTTTNLHRVALNNSMDSIYSNINSTDEKRNANTPYGNLMYDAFNYFAGRDQSQAGAGTLNTIADNGGYNSTYTTFKSPLSCATNCANSYVILISNPNQNGPASDDATNTSALEAAGRAVSPPFAAEEQILLTNYTSSSTTVDTDLTPLISTNRYRSSQLSTCHAAVTAANSGVAASYTDGLVCKAPTTDCTGRGGAEECKYTVYGRNVTTTISPTGTFTRDTSPFNADEWARLMFEKGVPVGTCTDRQKVTTYTVDVFNAQPNNQHTSLMQSMAVHGGGEYFAAKNKQDLVNAIKNIVRQILSKNSTFASASLPINATNRSQNLNQVYIGMFRPDPDTKPRWLGNLKRYQIIERDSSLTLGDSLGNPAINTQTGFIDECAVSYYTSDSVDYWYKYFVNANVSQIKPDPKGLCTTLKKLDGSPYDDYSDYPDGPRVEKGSVAEVMRKGSTANPNSPADRNVLTYDAGSITAFPPAGSVTTTTNWVKGYDTENEAGLATPDATKTRASLHGDVVHSRPLPVNYGAATSGAEPTVITYYGANDGTFRAVRSTDGKELWAFVAPEFFSKLDRLRTGTPLVQFSGGTTTGAVSKDYFFDGSIGLYQNIDNSKIWIYPTMRRGGRMIYAFDVSGSGTNNSTPPSSPTLKWRFGCPNLTDNSGCTTGATEIGQTWSIPRIAKVKVSSTIDATGTRWVAIVGGGYDTCEDRDSTTTLCTTGSVKGNKIYVLDAENGSLLKAFTTRRSVIGDVALVDTDGDGLVDYGYVGDTGGNLYRISFSTFAASPIAYTALDQTAWTLSLIAYTRGGGRKFQFQPSLFYAQGAVYIGLGSGDRERPLVTNYPYASSVQNRFYMYRDCLSITRSAYTDLDSTSGIDNLDDITKMNRSAAVTIPGPPEIKLASCTSPQTLPTNCSTNKGWFIELNNGRGEQTVTSSVISGGLVAFSTNRALDPTGSQVCSALGEARGYWLNVFSGAGAVGVDGICGSELNGVNPAAASAIFVGGGLPPSPVLGSVVVGGDLMNVVIGAVNKTGSGANTAIAPQQTKSDVPPNRRKVYDYLKGLN